MKRAGVAAPPSPGPGQRSADLHHAPLQQLWARLVTAPGTYEQGMLIDQLANLARAESGADQKIGAESRQRFADLRQELHAFEADLRTLGEK